MTLFEGKTPEQNPSIIWRYIPFLPTVIIVLITAKFSPILAIIIGIGLYLFTKQILKNLEKQKLEDEALANSNK